MTTSPLNKHAKRLMWGKSMTDIQILTFERAEPGLTFPPYTFDVREDEVHAYLEVLSEQNPLYWDDTTAAQAGFQGRVVPPVFMNRFAHFIPMLHAMGWERPEETFHAGSQFTFLAPVYIGDTITSTLQVEQRYERRGKKYVTFRIDAVNQRGVQVATKIHTSVWGTW